VALETAAARGGFARVVLHCDRDLSGSPHWERLEALPGFEARILDPEALFAAAGSRGAALWALFGQLSKPAAQANMVRAAILATEGGVYLDTDTVTLRDLGPLRARAGAFCGVERIALPYQVKASRDPAVWAAAGLRVGARELCRRLPEGWRWFRQIERWYPAAANNAVLGCAPGHPLALALLDGMLATPPERRLVRFALGTHLLQRTLERPEIAAQVEICAPEVFYPLAPEISEHWFRPCSPPPLDEVLSPETLIVHWYASVRTEAVIPRLSPEHVAANARSELFSALVSRALTPTMTPTPSV
jgi:hypothetical protein